jgi:2-polyprenyl-3-methyl-5-hydroxy-6-metoxy-1,4-benzoquinol methylase
MAYTEFDRFVARCRFRAALPHIREGTRICDIGCGKEAGFIHFAEQRIRLGVGVDYQFPQDSDRRTAVITANILQGLPFQSAAFDHAVMLAVLEHLPEPGPVLSEIFRILKPGGSLILSWPSETVDAILVVTRALGLTSREMESEDHVARLPAETLQTLLRQIGFGRFDHRRFEFGLNNLLVAFKNAQ